MNEIDRLDVAEAARMMGVTEQFVRLGLQQNRFPWGYAVLMGRHYSYWINRKRFEEVET